MNVFYTTATIGGIIALLFASYTVLPSFMATTYEHGSDVLEKVHTTDIQEEAHNTSDERAVVTHQPIPEEVRAIYMTACVAGTPSFRDSLISLIERTELNAVVIDVKDFSGTIAFPPESEELRPAWQAAGCGTTQMQELVNTLHEKGIFTIARITVFQDPFYTEVRPDLAVRKASDNSTWKDHKGLSFIDVGAREYWDYIIELSKETYALGFDELNFDYVRYPSDGNMKDIAFTHSATGTKQENLETFFQYLHKTLSDPELYAEIRHENTGRASATPYLSADLFGMTTTNTDDLSIGQVLERAAPYFDFIAPMVYPSHYPDSFLGLGNPNEYPYKVVHHAMSSGVDRMTASTTVVESFVHEPLDPTSTSTPVVYKKPVYSADKLRTWIQDFDYGGDYGAEEVRAQIQASYDAGVDSYMIWAPSNIYTESALHPASSDSERQDLSERD